jgi:hypothetical protein
MTHDQDANFEDLFREFESARDRQREYLRHLPFSSEPLTPVSTADLKALIEHAFERTPRPDDDNISATTYDDEGTAEYFRGRAWHGHTPQALRQHEAALSFFSDDAYRYFLPAYMLAELEDPEAADVIAQHIIHGLTPQPPEDPGHAILAARLVKFTVAEKNAIAAFVKNHYHRYGIPDEFEVRVLLASLAG